VPERGRKTTRLDLQALLYPDEDAHSGAHSLRQLLYKLRQRGVALAIDANGIMIRPEDVKMISASSRQRMPSLLR